MAQGLAKLCFGEGFEVMSAGLQAFDGDRVSENAVKVLEEKGIDIGSHRAVRLTADMAAQADFLFTMTRSQAILLTSIYPEFRHKIHCLGDYCGLGKEVSDPWGGSLEHYRTCGAEIEQMLKKVVSVLNKP
jgi:protein-tyrosine phosphatase